MGKIDSVSRKASTTLNSEQQIARMSEVHNFNGPELDNLKILHHKTVNKKILREFRELRTQTFARAGKHNYVCMVTSVCPGGGATYTASNLAAAIALDKAKTSVVIDCDFYSPSMNSLLSAEANLGLADFLSVPDMGVEFVLYASGIRRLRIIPAGTNRGGATEKLSSSKMRRCLAELKSRYSDRYIVIDSPSVGESPADVRILAELCDFVILVVPYARVSGADIKSSIDIIGEHHIAGVVFNNC